MRYINRILEPKLNGYLNRFPVAFHFNDAKAFTIYGSFIALLFITPIIGGVLSDRYLGKVHSIILGGIVMGIGNLILALNQPQQVYLWLDYRCYR